MSPRVKPRILIVDDDPRIGRMLKQQIQQHFGFKVCFPETRDALQDTVLYETFDSVLVDANLNKWKPGLRVFGKEVKDGVDFASAYCGMQEKSLTVIFGPRHLPSQALVARRIKKLSKCNVRIIERPLPSGDQQIRNALEAIKPEIEEAEFIHQKNPIFQPVNLYKRLPVAEKNLREHLLYRQACRRTNDWTNYNFHYKNADSSWAVLCGGNLQKDYFGEVLDKRSQPAPDVTIWRTYPRPSQFAQLATREKTNAFVFWNTHNAGILAKQFDDQRISKIPETLEDSFGIAVAPSCAKFYNEQDEKHVMKWCKKLSHFGRLEALKQIFRSLNGDRERSVREFSQRCKKAQLHRVVDVYKARVEQMTESDNTAIVEMTNLSRDEKFAAPLDLSLLVRKGVKEPNQCFEYTVYVDVNEDAFGVIELTE